jgi:hypothetical protein
VRETTLYEVNTIRQTPGGQGVETLVLRLGHHPLQDRGSRRWNRVNVGVDRESVLAWESEEVVREVHHASHRRGVHDVVHHLEDGPPRVIAALERHDQIGYRL